MKNKDEPWGISRICPACKQKCGPTGEYMLGCQVYIACHCSSLKRSEVAFIDKDKIEVSAFLFEEKERDLCKKQ